MIRQPRHQSPAATVSFSQLWPEEQEILKEMAALVPDQGIIVDIGTAQGGSAYLFHAATCSRDVKIFSYDPYPSAEAWEHLKDTTVTIIPQSSVMGARDWQKRAGALIDLIFIDGSHTLGDVYTDFVSWVPYLRPGGQIIFHDFDSQERGGLVHLGTQIALSTILRLGLLENPRHRLRLLGGTIQEPDQVQLGVKDLAETFEGLARDLVALRQADLTGCAIVGEEKFAQLLGVVLKLADSPPRLTPPEAAPGRPYLVIARPLAPALATLAQRGVAAESLVIIDNLQAAYLVAEALRKDRDYLLNAAASRSDFFLWEELLFMFDHACGCSAFPDQPLDPRARTDLDYLSRLVAREQVRLMFLARILETLVGWMP
ncbi:MAG: class I SAM-dependent methyltransferase [Thermodesulfobacteriota bacterium]